MESDVEYARFLEAAAGLADVAVELPPPARLRLELALLAAWKSADRATAALGASPDRLEHAAAELQHARVALVDAGRDVSADAARAPVAWR